MRVVMTTAIGALFSFGNITYAQIMLVVNGIHLLENLKLDELASRRLYEFALIVEPIAIH